MNNRQILRRDRAAYAACDPKCYTRAQAIEKIKVLGVPELVERFTHHQNYHVKARAESKLRAIANVLPGECCCPVEADAVAPVGCGVAPDETPEAPACCDGKQPVVKAVPLPDPTPVLVEAVGQCATIKAVRELLVGVTNQAARDAGNARIQAIREANAAKKAARKAA